MKFPSYLSLSRHHIFRFRRRVPDDLRRYFQSNELRRSWGSEIDEELCVLHACSRFAPTSCSRSYVA